MKNKLFISILIVSGFWGFTSIIDKTNSQCVNVYVDFGSLDQSKKVIGCIDTNTKIKAIDVIQKSGLKVEGTDKYGLQVICRVDSLPGPDRESCAVMPPENAYWAFIVRDKSTPLNPITKWGWAQKGINDVYLNPGDSLGLVFTEDGKMRWPD